MCYLRAIELEVASTSSNETLVIVASCKVSSDNRAQTKERGQSTEELHDSEEGGLTKFCLPSGPLLKQDGLEAASSFDFFE